jgi:hypothetical protein
MNDSIMGSPRRVWQMRPSMTRNRSRARLCTRTALVMGVALLGVSQFSAVAVAAEPVPAKSAPASSQQGTVSSRGPAGEAQTASSCSDFWRNIRAPYKSGSAAYGWGGWQNISCPTSRAVVTVTLQEYTSGAWRTVVAAAPTLPSGYGVTVGASCFSSAYTYWRTIVDVDLVGVSDPADKQYAYQYLYCRR